MNDNSELPACFYRHITGECCAICKEINPSCFLIPEILKEAKDDNKV